MISFNEIVNIDQQYSTVETFFNPNYKKIILKSEEKDDKANSKLTNNINKIFQNNIFK